MIRLIIESDRAGSSACFPAASALRIAYSNAADSEADHLGIRDAPVTVVQHADPAVLVTEPVPARRGLAVVDAPEFKDRQPVVFAHQVQPHSDGTAHRAQDATPRSSCRR